MYKTYRCEKCNHTEEYFIKDGKTPVHCDEDMSWLPSGVAIEVSQGTKLEWKRNEQ